jgi:hypothetical protein
MRLKTWRRLSSLMAKFNFFIQWVIRTGDEADAKMFLQELIADDNTVFSRVTE